MNKRTVLKFLLASGVIVVLSACGKNPAPGTDASMKVINLGIDLGAINAAYDDSGDKSFASNVAREATSTYATVKGGARDYSVTAVVAGGSATPATALFRQPFAATPGARYSLLVFGTAAAARGMIVQDDNVTAPDAGRVRMRVAVAAFGLDPLDVYVTAPGADISTINPTFSSVANGATSAVADFEVGARQLRATISGTKTLVYQSNSITFADRERFTLALYTVGSGKQANAALIRIDDVGTLALARSANGRSRFFNGIAAYPQVNVLFNNQVTLFNVPYRGVLDYVSAPVAARALTVAPSNTPGTNIISDPAFTLSPAQDSTIVLVGSLGQASTLVLADTTLPSLTNRARIRFVNASIGSGALDGLVRSQVVAAALAERAASAYFEYDAGTYDMSVNRGTTSLSALPGVVLAAGKVYTIFIVGPSGNVQGVVVQDN